MAKRTTTDEQEKWIVGVYREGNSRERTSLITGYGTMVVQRVLKEWHVPAHLPYKPYQVNIDAFSDLSREEDSYWLGFMFADATVRRSSTIVGLARKDEDHLMRLATFLGCPNRIRRYEVGLRGVKHACVRLAVSDRRLADLLRSYGIEPHRPNSLTTLGHIPAKSINHFLRGWFDGDGSALVFPRLNFIGPRPFVEAVSKIFQDKASTNPVTLFPKSKTRDIVSLSYKGVYRCQGVVAFLYDNATIYMGRKKDRIDSWCGPVRGRQTRFWG